MQLDDIILHLQDVYINGRNPHEADPTLNDRIHKLVQRLSDTVARFIGTVPVIRGPINLDGYHLICWPLRPGLPSDPADIYIPSLSTSAMYLTARVCHFIPLVELSWLMLGHKDGQPFRRSAELLDATILNADPRAETVALTALETVEQLGLETLSWELLRSPAPSEWPRQFWMPEQPEIRNFIFPGFFETWPAPRRKV